MPCGLLDIEAGRASYILHAGLWKRFDSYRPLVARWYMTELGMEQLLFCIYFN
jgi:hypothetical protein